jgi:hypothetical protein
MQPRASGKTTGPFAPSRRRCCDWELILTKVVPVVAEGNQPLLPRCASTLVVQRPSTPPCLHLLSSGDVLALQIALAATPATRYL